MEQYRNDFINQPIVKKHLGLFFIGFILGLLTFGFINFEASKKLGQLLLSGFLGVLVVYPVFYSNSILNKILDWKNTGLRLLLGLVGHTLMALLIIWLGIFSFQWISIGQSNLQFLDMETQLKLIILSCCASLIYNVAYFAFYSYNQFSKIQLLELQTKRKQAELQLAMLKSQLSPHFLFNCMNTLSVLFHDQTDKAESFIRSMATSYQYTLEQHRKSLVTLGEELEFVKSYVLLLKTRFGEGLDFKVNLKEELLVTKIPPLTLQLLVENAVHHNRVQITGSRSALEIKNNKVPKKQKKASTGIGLKNIIERYKILSKAEVTIENTQDFTVTIPILTNE